MSGGMQEQNRNISEWIQDLYRLRARHECFWYM